MRNKMSKYRSFRPQSNGTHDFIRVLWAPLLENPDFSSWCRRANKRCLFIADTGEVIEPFVLRKIPLGVDVIAYSEFVRSVVQFSVIGVMPYRVEIDVRGEGIDNRSIHIAIARVPGGG